MQAGEDAEQETHDCDSEELEALEDAAEEEGADEEELDIVAEEAALLYPPEAVSNLIDELKQDGLVQFMQSHIVGKTEREIKLLFVALGVLLPKSLREESVSPGVLVSILKTVLIRHLRQRKKLLEYNTVEDAVRLIGQSKRIIVLSGSGISTSVGIPDFRSKDGIYAQLQREGKYNLADPQEMFDKDFFLHDPSCFFSFAKSIFPSNFIPSPSHRFIKLLEERKTLLRNYTQNIDTLEEAAGIENVLYCHGSFSQAQCTTPGCDYKVAGSAIKSDIFAQKVPYCPNCALVEERKRAIQTKSNGKSRGWNPKDFDDSDDDQDDDDGQDGLRGLGVLKPCITFFGEKLSDDFDHSLLADRRQVDLLIVMGTSLKVAPVSELVGHIPHQTPVILINKTPVLHMAMDIQLLGDADIVVEYICNRLQWPLPSPEPNKDVVGKQSVANEVHHSGVPDDKEQEPKQVGQSHFWLFSGAEVDGLVSILEKSSNGIGGSSSGSGGEDSDEQQAEVPISRGIKRSGSSGEEEIDDVQGYSKHQRHV